MKSLTFLCLICALNQYINCALKIAEKEKKLLEVGNTAKSCSKRQKLLKRGRAQSIQA